MTNYWPETLPQAPLKGSVTVATEPNLASFKPDVGGSIRRRRYTASRMIMSATMHLIGDQRHILQNFYHSDCFDGVLPFEGPDWSTQEPGKEQWARFWFENPPEFQHFEEDHWRVRLTIYKIT